MAKNYDDGRFVAVYQGVKIGGMSAGSTRILVDRTTGVQYILHSWGDSAGFTVLAGQDGKPLLYQPSAGNQ